MSNDLFSPSGLARFAVSPKAYFFSKLPNVEDSNLYAQRGTVLHDLAEWVVTDPDRVQANRKALLDRAVDAMSEYIDPWDRDRYYTRFDLGIESLMDFYDQVNTQDLSINAYINDGSETLFDDIMGDSPQNLHTEVWFENPELGGKGRVDWVMNDHHLVDFKSGRSHSLRKLIEKNRVEPSVYDEPSFQAILYLAHHRTQTDQPLKFTYYYLFNDQDDRLIGEPDIEDNIRTIRYEPDGPESLVSPAMFETLTSGVAESNDRRKTLEKMGPDAFQSVFSALPLDRSVLDETDLTECSAFPSVLQEAQKVAGEYKYVQKGVESAVKKIQRKADERLFPEDIDAFESFLSDQLEYRRQCRADGFNPDHPATGSGPEDTFEHDLVIDPEVRTPGF